MTVAVRRPRGAELPTSCSGVTLNGSVPRPSGVLTARRPRSTVQVNDSPEEDLTAHFERCFQFIDGAIQRGGGCLVVRAEQLLGPAMPLALTSDRLEPPARAPQHCFAGKSRSVTVVLAYLMRTRQCTLQVRRKIGADVWRPCSRGHARASPLEAARDPAARIVC